MQNSEIKTLTDALKVLVLNCNAHDNQNPQTPEERKRWTRVRKDYVRARNGIIGLLEDHEAP